MTSKILTIFTRTPLHIGCGSSVGAVDQPVVRERHTSYPVIPGSSIKGVLADLWMEEGKDVRKNVKAGKNGEEVEYIRIKEGDAYKLFGNNESGENAEARSGKLLIGEGKILAFPVRSAGGGYAWMTCPLVLKRFKLDAREDFEIPEKVSDSEVVLTSKSVLLVGESDEVVFESFPFSKKGDCEADSVALKLADYVAPGMIFAEVINRLAIVSDTVFAYFVTNMCEIANHNRIDDCTGVVATGALFSQENVPSETLFYSPLMADKEYLKIVDDKLGSKDVGWQLQIGADATTGLGQCTVFTKEVC